MGSRRTCGGIFPSDKKTRLNQPRRDIPIFFVNGNHVRRQTYHSSCSDFRFQMCRTGKNILLTGSCFDRFQHRKVFCSVFGGGALFDLDGCQNSVLIDQKVDFLFVAVPIKIKRRLLSCVQILL